MSASFPYLTLIFLVFYTSLMPVEGIKCYQCSSIEVEKNPYQCTEFFEDSELEPEPCDNVHNAQYCIKQIGTFEGGLQTKRFCSSEYLGNYCNYLKQPGGRAPYRSCYFTCEGDGCNSASRFSSISLTISFWTTTAISLLRQFTSEF